MARQDSNEAFQLSSFLYGGNAGYLEDLYARYQQGFRPGGLSIANDTVHLYRNDRLGTAEAGSGWSSGRCVTTIIGTWNGFCPPQCEEFS